MQITQYKDWDGTFPALVAGMPNDIYHQQDGISNSGLSLVARSPAHYYHAPRSASTRAMEIGTAFHTALLEPERYAAEYMVVTGCDDRRVSAYKDAAKVYGGDKTLTASEGASVSVMSESIRSNPAAHDLLSQPGRAELSAFVRDPETGVLMRCRFDWITDDDVVIDLKKTQDCREHAFSRSLHNYRYHVQAAMYSHIYSIVFGKPLQSFKLLAVEEQPPCANVLYDICPLAMQHGHTLYRQALESFAQALETDCWESYSGTGVVTLPEFVLAALDNNDDEGIY
jgi:exodeoxyribonuclease VIII